MSNFLYMYAVLVGIGITTVVILIFFEQKKSIAKGKKSVPHPSTEVLQRLGLKEAQELVTKAVPQDVTSKNPKETQTNIAQTKPESVSLSLLPTESEEYLALKNKYERLEGLFEEKSTELDKKETVLANELKIRKDFNKVKDILEKELKDTKDKVHKFHLELTAAKGEIENQKNRVLQLEEKINGKNKDITEREGKIAELTKQLLNLTGKSPQTPTQVANKGDGDLALQDSTATVPGTNVIPSTLSEEKPVSVLPQQNSPIPPEETPKEASPPQETLKEAETQTPIVQEKTSPESANT